MPDETDAAVPWPLVDNDLTYREAHALLDGCYCGVVGVREHEYGREKHWWRLGWLLGDLYDRRVRR